MIAFYVEWGIGNFEPFACQGAVGNNSRGPGRSISADPALAGYTACEKPLLSLILLPYVLSTQFVIPWVLPNCLKGGSGREFDQGLSPGGSPRLKKHSRNRRLKIDKIVNAFNVKHFPQKSSPRKKKSPKVSLNDAKNCIPIASRSILF